jgi:hypothetical protein
MLLVRAYGLIKQVIVCRDAVVRSWHKAAQAMAVSLRQLLGE